MEFDDRHTLQPKAPLSPKRPAEANESWQIMGFQWQQRYHTVNALSHGRLESINETLSR